MPQGKLFCKKLIQLYLLLRKYIVLQCKMRKSLLPKYIGLLEVSLDERNLKKNVFKWEVNEYLLFSHLFLCAAITVSLSSFESQHSGTCSKT